MTPAANKGFHPLLEREQPYLFVDSCMQIWPDADFANAHRHGVAAYAVTAWDPSDGVAEALAGAMFWHLVARQHDNLLIAERAEDIRRAHREGRAALILAAQGGEFIGDKLHRIEAFHRLGLRMLLPAYNRTNLICDGCLDRTDAGLTRFGELVVDECNRVGVLLDCTHIGRRASLELIARSDRPVVFSHSNPKALVDNPRNIDDEQIRACAARGGVIGVASWGPLVMQDGQTERPTLDQFLDHIDYVAQLTGSTDHLGIGTDMSLGTYPDHAHDPWGEPAYADVAGRYARLISADVRSPLRAVAGFSAYPEIVDVIEALLRRGYGEGDVRKILGENYLRVFAQACG
ncbi:MAG TPA: membrane dipeptidase [Thermomicrobiales bacterium]|nr:membrane dipeptidase [Thermomicrobiales bacterium]